MKPRPGPPATSGPVAGAPDRARPLTNAFLDGLRHERGYSARTIEAYRIDLEELLQLLAACRAERSASDQPDPGWSLVDEHLVRRWVARCSACGLSPRSIARRLSAWRGFFDWLLERGEVRTNAIRRVRAPRAPRLLPRALAPDQAVRLVAAPYPGPASPGPASGEPEPASAMLPGFAPAQADAPPSQLGSAGDAAQPGDDPQGLLFEAARDRAMFELLYSSGLRLAELVSLDVRCFDGPPMRSASWLELDAGELVVTGKGSRMRRLPVGRAAVTALADWLPVRERFLAAIPAADARALFLGRRGARIGARMVQRRIAARGEATGIEVPVSPHMLRHSFASHLLQSSGDLRAVQELLGHASIASTQIYTALDFQRLAAVYDAAHPRARRSGGASDR